jgi:type I restriction enzyme S subunit
MSRLREGWTSVRFGDVVRLSTERCTDPFAQGIERYVGLEHLEPGDLRISSWGNVADGVTFTNRFRPGQVLFGKRRAYQRKVAVAEFDGICSSDIYVFEPADDRLLPDLLPFICQTDGFFEHALKTSAGSLSPRTNWSSLADYEFDLPPIEEQRRQAVIAATVDRTRLKSEECVVRGELAVRATSNHLFARDLCNHSVTLGALVSSGVIHLQTGPFGTVLAASSYTKAGVPVVNPVNMNGDSIDTADGPFVAQSHAAELTRYRMEHGDVVMCRKRHVGKMFFVRPEYSGFVVGSDCIRLRTNGEQLLGRYLFFYMTSPGVQEWLKGATTGTVMPGISESALQRLQLPLPPLDQQQRLVSLLETMSSTVSSLHQRHKSLAEVRSTLLRRMSQLN